MTIVATAVMPALPHPAQPPPRDGDPRKIVAAQAALFARYDEAVAEAALDALAARAIADWRLDDATFWQRVRYQARLSRAVGRSRQRPVVT